MTGRRGLRDPGHPVRQDDLAVILETEQRLAASLEEARAEARALVENARTAAQEMEASADGDLAAGRDRARKEEEQYRETELRRIRQAGETRIRTYQAVNEERIATLARSLLDRLYGNRADGSRP